MRANSYIKDIFKTWASPDLSRWRHCKICVFQFGVTVAVKYRVNWTLLTCGCFKSCYRQTGSGIGLPDGRCSTGLAGTLRCADNWDLFVWDHILGQDFIIWDHIHVRLYHLRPHSLETTFAWDHIRLRPHSLETTLTWDVNHIFMIYLPLLCGRHEVLQGGSSFEVLQGYALPCPRWLTLGCKCTLTLKTPQGPENSSYLGFGRERCTSEISFCVIFSTNAKRHVFLVHFSVKNTILAPR